MSIKFAKYYNVTELVNKMISEDKLDCYKDVIDLLTGVYICNDTNDFWVARINKNLNEDYEEEDGIYLIERNMIAKYDVIKKVCDEFNKEEPRRYTRFNIHDFINETSENELFQAVLLIDDFNCLENWDNCQCNSLREAVDTLADIYGIEEFRIV